MTNWIAGWGMLILSVVFNALGVFVIKMRLNDLGAVTMESFAKTVQYFLLMLKAPLVIIGVILFFLAPFLFAIALSRMEIVVAYPAQIGLNFLILVVLAVVFLGEQVTLVKVLGTVLILAGVFLLNKTG